MVVDRAIRAADQNLPELHFAVPAFGMPLYSDLFPIFSGGSAQTRTL